MTVTILISAVFCWSCYGTHRAYPRLAGAYRCNSEGGIVMSVKVMFD